MNFREIMLQIREAYENADARMIFEHVAIEFHITGDFEGVFYLEVAERQICIEPYEYENADAVVTISSDVVLQLIQNKVSTSEAIAQRLIQVEGNMDKIRLLQKMTQKNK